MSSRTRVLSAQRFCSEVGKYLYDLEMTLLHTKSELNKIEKILTTIIEHSKEEKIKEEAQNALNRIDRLFTGEILFDDD